MKGDIEADKSKVNVGGIDVKDYGIHNTTIEAKTNMEGNIKAKGGSDVNIGGAELK
jgi:hypothetical protein